MTFRRFCVLTLGLVFVALAVLAAVPNPLQALAVTVLGSDHASGLVLAMTPLGIYDTAVLTRTINRLDMQPPLFFLNTLAKLIQTSESDRIYFDVTKVIPRIAPFVAPHLPGKIVEEVGYDTYDFKPAYVKPKMALDAKGALKRRAGEPLAGSLSPAERQRIRLKDSLYDLAGMLNLREEVMVSEFLRTGSITVKGEGFPTVTVDLKRDATLTVTLLNNDRWSVVHADSDPLLDLETMSGRSVGLGAGPTPLIIMDPLAFALFRARLKERGELVQLLDYLRGGDSSIEVAPGLGEKVERKGKVGNYEIIVYQDTYKDDEGVTQKVMPDYTVVGVGPSNLELTRCYGVVEDEEADFKAEQFFAKSWLEKDPAKRWVLGQSAPLPVAYRPNASWCLKVNG